MVNVTTPESFQQEKPRYSEVSFSGQVEREYIYGLIIAEHLLPYIPRGHWLAVLPIEPFGDKYRSISNDSIQERGHSNMLDWVNEIETLWETMGVGQSYRGRIEFQNKLDRQNPNALWVVAIAAHGQDLCASVLDLSENLPISSSLEVNTNGILFDGAVNYCYFEDESEAHYVSAILNSSWLTKLTSPLMTQGSAGAGQNIHQKPFSFPWVEFDSNNPQHILLSELSIQASQQVRDLLSNPPTDDNPPETIARLRPWIRNHIQGIRNQIDQVLKDIYDWGYPDEEE